MTDYASHVEQVKAAFDSVDVDPDFDDDGIENRLETLIEEYAVPEAEARRSAIRSLGEEYGVDPLSSSGSPDGGGNEDVVVSDIDTAGAWVNVEVQMVENWDPNHGSIAQTGLVGDESGTIKFTSWEDANQPELEAGASYRLESVVTDSYQGRMSIQLQDVTEVTALDRDVEVGQETETERGVIVAINSGSGLVKRCPTEDCTRVLQDGRCNEHGSVDGDFDLRLKAVLDDGQATQRVIFNREATARLTGMDLEEAKALAEEHLDTDAVIDEMEPRVINRYYEIEGPRYGEYLMASECTELDGPSRDEVEALLEVA